MPVHRYEPFIPVDLTDRTWPAKRIAVAPTSDVPALGRYGLQGD